MPRWTTKLSNEELKKRDRERCKRYYKENIEKIRLQRRKYRENKKLDLKYYNREYYLAHRKLKRKEE